MNVNQLKNGLATTQGMPALTSAQGSLSRLGLTQLWGMIRKRPKAPSLHIAFDNGWVAGLSGGGHGSSADDLPRYAWLYRPGSGYLDFDGAKLQLSEVVPSAVWSAAVSGPAGTLKLSARAHHGHQQKPSTLWGIPLGGLKSHRHPIEASGYFTEASGQTTALSGKQGLLEGEFAPPI